MKILYLVHDLSDPAVQRRVRMLSDGGAVVTVAGFRRAAEPIPHVAGCAAINLGQTYSGGFAQRIWSVLREVFHLARYHQLFADTDIIMARNLEMLAIAVRGRSLCPAPPVLVYESLDIHRLLLNKGPVGISLRMLEGWLSKRASALITSSPAFVTSYFEVLSRVRLPVRLLENKVYAPDMKDIHPLVRPAGPPWRIGWFGMIRCRKSLQMLTDLVKQSNGTVEVVIRGRVALDQIPDFYKIAATTPGLSFAGAYKNPEDLAAIYQDVHFSWSIDMYEEGLNSSWLLPNRLYEGGLFNAVPIALKSVETGRFLERLGIGVTLAQPPDSFLKSFFRNLTNKHYQSLEKYALETSRVLWRYDKKDSEALVEYLNALKVDLARLPEFNDEGSRASSKAGAFPP
jgi:succinoglycan biosynthesis protein ExoL